MNDIKNIIYRIIWTTRTKLINQQYTSTYYEKNGVIFLFNTNGYAFQYRRSIGGNTGRNMDRNIGGWRFIWHINTNNRPDVTDIALPHNYF